MKTARAPKTAMKRKPRYVVGAKLPDRLPRETIALMKNAVTPQLAYEIAERIARITAKNRQNENK